MKLCLEHKVELWKRGYRPMQAIALIPWGFKDTCSICNGEWKRNWDESRRLIEDNAKAER